MAGELGAVEEEKDGSGSRPPTRDSKDEKEKSDKPRTVDDQTEDLIAATAKYLSRRVGVTNDDVDLIMASRQTKWNIEIPSTEVSEGRNVRVAFVEHKDMEHMFMEVKTGEYDNNCARPEIELFTIGCGAAVQEPSGAYLTKEDALRASMTKKQKADRIAQQKVEDTEQRMALPPNERDAYDKKKKKEKARQKKVTALFKDNPIYDKSKGKGIEVIYDLRRQTFCLSNEVEDSLLLLLRNDHKAGYSLSKATTKYGKSQLDYIDDDRRRIWRRFVREYLQPKLEDETRFASIARRWKLAKEEAAKKNRVLDASEVQYSDTDSEEEEERKKSTKGGKAVAARKKK